MKLKLLTLLFACFCGLNAWAQMGKLFNADNQLSSNFANYVFQDRDGFIWVSTRNGLNRYDGYKFRIFKKEDEKCGLTSNYVNCINQSQNGTIYVGCHNSIQIYDGSRFHEMKLLTDDGKPIYSFVNKIVETKAGEMLACTSGYGILKLNEKDNTGKIDKALTGNQNYVRTLLEDSHGRFWMMTENNGLFLLQGKKRIPFFTDEESRSSLCDIRQDRKGNVYVAVRDKGVYRYDENQHQFVFIPKTAGLPISAFSIDRDDHLMLGCDGKGIYEYQPQTDNLVDNPFYSRDIDLTKGKVSSILEGRNGNIWICLLQKGLFMQPQAKGPFGYMGERLGDRNLIGNNCVTSTLIDKRGRAWVGTDKDGLYLLDKNAQMVRHFTNCPSTILCMAEDVHGHIWMGSYNEGYGWLDPSTGAWHPETVGFGSKTNVFGLAAAANGDVWLASMGNGLVRYNVLTGVSTRFSMKPGADNDRTMNSLPNNYLSKVCLSDDEQKLFVGSSIGLCCYDIAKDSWVTTFGSNCPNYGIFSRSIYADKKGRVWLATNEGLYCYDLKTRKDTIYTLRDGLPSIGIASIVSDKQGNLWVGTDHGLCNFKPGGSSINYYVDNGLQGSEFSDGAVSINNETGMLLFGGTGGVTWFLPSDVKTQTWNPKLQITGFVIGNTPVTAGMKSGSYTITEKTVINSDRFDLCYEDNSFIIQLSTFTYNNSEHITYLYSINGEEWIKLQTGVNEIAISHLAPGTYRFRVKAMSNQLETDIKEFVVKVHAPWYATSWAFLCYLLLAAFAIYAIYRHLRRKQQDRMRLQEHIHAEELADAKLRFFMNISHEIRTPMTLIVTPLLSLMKQDDDPQRRGLYETIRRNAERILGLINQMMDFRKIDKGQMQMRMCETDLIGFVDDIYTLFAQQAKMKNIRFSFDHDSDKLPVWVDRSNFDKVVVNILSNAFKFTPPGGNIRIHITHDDTHAKIAVRDSGEGIPEDKLQHIFERFYQLPTTSSKRVGTGIGLDLTRSLVELHHGTIEAHNNQDGKGCEFVVTIPLGNAHLQPEEMMTETQEPIQMITAMEEELTNSLAKETPLKMSNRQRLVIVEDDDEIRKYLMDELGSDYDVVGCENGLVGLKEVLKSSPDLVISDVMMPEMDGNTLCSKIRSNPSVSHIPVILLTAKSLDEDQLEGLETGADAYIVKPFNMDILRRTIINLINKSYNLRMKYGRNDQLEEKVDEIQVKSPDDRLLERVMNVINKNLNNSDLSVDRIADEVGISRVHLHRKMKELTGQTPHDFIRNIRLKQAAHLLANQNMNVTEVMYACGFNNPASFSTIFKKFYGLSPRDFMKEHTKE